MTLEEFNSADRDQARAALRPCVDIDRWVDAVVDARPYSNVEEVLATARSAADPWTSAEIDGALAHHPRIGERASGKSVEASLSRSEQAGVNADDAALISALADGNRAYEEKFGRVFLIRAAGRSASEMLEALQERLMHTPQEEIPVVAEQLREIALLRLEALFTGGKSLNPMSQVTTHILDAALGRPAAGVRVALQDGSGVEIANGKTDDDGRVKDLGPERLEVGNYRLSFATGDYFAETNRENFYPVVSIDFSVADSEQHYHVPLLISPFAYSTYRGS